MSCKLGLKGYCVCTLKLADLQPQDPTTVGFEASTKLSSTVMEPLLKHISEHPELRRCIIVPAQCFIDLTYAKSVMTSPQMDDFACNLKQKIMPIKYLFVILLIEGSHWVLLQNSFEKKESRVFDSTARADWCGKLSWKDSINKAVLLFNQRWNQFVIKKELSDEFVFTGKGQYTPKAGIIRQENGIDCGVHCIAQLTYLIFGRLNGISQITSFKDKDAQNLRPYLARLSMVSQLPPGHPFLSRPKIANPAPLDVEE